MTTAFAARSDAGLVAPANERKTGWAADLRRAWQNRRVYRSTLAELRSLTDRELRDIGISRAALKRIAHEAAYGN